MITIKVVASLNFFGQGNYCTKNLCAMCTGTKVDFSQCRTQKNIIECRDQLTMRKDNYAYFVSNKGEPRDVGSKLLENYGK